MSSPQGRGRAVAVLGAFAAVGAFAGLGGCAAVGEVGPGSANKANQAAGALSIESCAGDERCKWVIGQINAYDVHLDPEVRKTKYDSIVSAAKVNPSHGAREVFGHTPYLFGQDCGDSATSTTAATDSQATDSQSTSDTSAQSGTSQPKASSSPGTSQACRSQIAELYKPLSGVLPSESTIIHGNATDESFCGSHTAGAVIKETSGRMTMCNFREARNGRASFDLLHLAVSLKLAGADQTTLQAFVNGYVTRLNNAGQTTTSDAPLPTRFDQYLGTHDHDPTREGRGIVQARTKMLTNLGTASSFKQDLPGGAAENIPVTPDADQRNASPDRGAFDQLVSALNSLATKSSRQGLPDLFFDLQAAAKQTTTAGTVWLARIRGPSADANDDIILRFQEALPASGPDYASAPAPTSSAQRAQDMANATESMALGHAPFVSAVEFGQAHYVGRELSPFGPEPFRWDAPPNVGDATAMGAELARAHRGTNSAPGTSITQEAQNLLAGAVASAAEAYAKQVEADAMYVRRAHGDETAPVPEQVAASDTTPTTGESVPTQPAAGAPSASGQSTFRASNPIN